MRKLLISILLASAAATPALADPPKDRDQAREERQQAREQRQQSRQDARSERQQSVQPQMRVQPQMQARQQTFNPPANVQTLERSNRFVPTVRDRADARQVRVDQRQQLRQDRVDARQQRQQDRVEAREIRQASRAPVISTVPRPGTQPPPRVDNRRPSNVQWSTNWRHNNKYDWYNYRHKHRSLFHLGLYFDPFGWGYQPYQIGWRLWPSYYSSRYWINDPYYYRLPYAPPGYQWVRYYNDAVLVDTWTGEVVDVLYDFFW
jgi:Ni/Co efflux regulator RcnB